MSVTRYKCVDLIVLALIMCLLEAAIAAARGFFPGEAYTVSVILPMTLIVCMRWGVWGLPHAALGGGLYAVLYGGAGMTVAVYVLGGLGALLSLAMFKAFGKEAICGSVPLTLVYCAMGWLGTGMSRGLAALIIGRLGLEEAIGVTLRFIATDALSAVIAVVVLLVARRQNGVFEDQMRYLARLKQEEEQKNDLR